MENKQNTGFLFPNKNKKADNHPDARGTINVEGKEYEIAAWTKTSEKAGKFYSLQVSEPYKKPEGDAKPQPPKMDEPASDDLPF